MAYARKEEAPLVLDAAGWTSDGGEDRMYIRIRRAKTRSPRLYFSFPIMCGIAHLSMHFNQSK